MTVAVYLAIYGGLLISLGGSAWRAWRYARLPVHLRWELYPVPHEEPRRAQYGGSYFEGQEWWRKPQQRHLLGEWLAMAEEILLLKSLRVSNPRLWISSYLFHLGIYLEIAALGLAALTGLAGNLVLISKTAVALGLAGAGLIIAGALMLLRRRLADPKLKNSTHAGDLFNLVFFAVAFGLLAGGYLLRPPGKANIAELAHGAVHFDRGVTISGLLAAGLMLTSALAAYIPFTHMAHFVAKYFTWHEVRWDDRRSERGGAIEKEVSALLNSAPGWAAPHIGADGTHNWAEIASVAAPEERR